MHAHGPAARVEPPSGRDDEQWGGCVRAAAPPPCDSQFLPDATRRHALAASGCSTPPLRHANRLMSIYDQRAGYTGISEHSATTHLP